MCYSVFLLQLLIARAQLLSYFIFLAFFRRFFCTSSSHRMLTQFSQWRHDFERLLPSESLLRCDVGLCRMSYPCNMCPHVYCQQTRGQFEHIFCIVFRAVPKLIIAHWSSNITATCKTYGKLRMTSGLRTETCATLCILTETCIYSLQLAGIQQNIGDLRSPLFQRQCRCQCSSPFLLARLCKF